MTGQISASETIEKGYASIVRKASTTLRSTAERTLINILKEAGLYHLIDHHKTDRTISFEGRVIECFGVDDAQKVRGRERDILFCNEANELNFYDDFNQLALRTKSKIFIDFNPDDKDVWINTELEQKRAAQKGDVEVIVSNYKWNGHLPRHQVEEIENLKNIDSDLWEVFGRGNYGKIQGTIFPDYEIIDRFPDSSALSIVLYGLDFGFQHPQAFVKVGYKEGLDGQPGQVFAKQLYYESHRTNGDFIEYLKDSDFKYTGGQIIADPAQAGSIAEIRNEGFDIIEAKKPKGSVYDGIMMMKRMKIHVVADSTDLLSEFRKYRWKESKDGRKAEPVKLFDDGIDSIRYCLFTTLFKKKSSGVYNRRKGFNPNHPSVRRAQRSIRSWNK